MDSNNVINGQTYYYALTAYDKGYDLDFFENGFSPSENLQAIAPSECSVTLDLDYKGNVVNLSQNAAIVHPNPQALGYIPPNTVPDGEKFVNHISGYGSGSIEVDVVDPFSINDGKEYHVVFDTLETADDLAFSIRNQELVIETLLINVDSSAVASELSSRVVAFENINTNDRLINEAPHNLSLSSTSLNENFLLFVDKRVGKYQWTDALTSIEFIAFADQTVAVSSMGYGLSSSNNIDIESLVSFDNGLF